jgi:hypothetical protein
MGPVIPNGDGRLGRVAWLLGLPVVVGVVLLVAG